MDEMAGSEATPAELRARARSGQLSGNTAALAPGYVQANIAILPRAHADAFADYCRANAQACPLLAMSEPGDPTLPALGEGIDIRHDLPRYRVYRDGRPEEAFDVVELWRDDLVTFATGCSFTFDNALLAQGVPLRHVALRRNIAMYRTRQGTVRVDRFASPLVVSMRPFTTEHADRAIAISAQFGDQHGAPVHRGEPAELGITDLQRTDYGDPVPIEPDDVTLFWACGVTSQTALQAAGLPFFISHAPGSMLVTDRRHAAA